ncbi:MAG: hypothetical protein HFI64_07750 [Lachnospiraceae bacterium]|nr:hypothetical protein [Lachnospiraceae bacterium]
MKRITADGQKRAHETDHGEKPKAGDGNWVITEPSADECQTAFDHSPGWRETDCGGESF